MLLSGWVWVWVWVWVWRGYGMGWDGMGCCMGWGGMGWEWEWRWNAIRAEEVRKLAAGGGRSSVRPSIQKGYHSIAAMHTSVQYVYVVLLS